MARSEHVYVTAAFGARYHRFAEGFCHSFARSMPHARLVVFTDDVNLKVPSGVEIRNARLDVLMEGLPPFYRSGRQRGTVAKFSMLRQVASESGVRQVTWSDVDALVVGDLDRLIVPGMLNFCRHGRHRAPVALGDSLVIAPEEYVVGGLYSLPSRGDVLATLSRLLAERPRVVGEDYSQLNMGDQPLVNRLRAVYRAEARFIGGPGVHLSLDIGAWWHPRTGDPGLRRHKLDPGGRIVTPHALCIPYIVAPAPCWDEWLATGFHDWDPRVAAHLRSFYPSLREQLEHASRRARYVVPILRQRYFLRVAVRRTVVLPFRRLLLGFGRSGDTAIRWWRRR